MCSERHLATVLQQPVFSERHQEKEPQSLEGIFGDAIVEACSRQLVRSERHLMAVLQTVGSEKYLAAVLQHRKGILGKAMVHRGRELPSGSLFRKNQYFPQAVFFSSRGQIRVRSANILVILPLPRYHAHLRDGLALLVIDLLTLPHSRMLSLISFI